MREFPFLRFSVRKLDENFIASLSTRIPHSNVTKIDKFLHLFSRSFCIWRNSGDVLIERLIWRRFAPPEVAGPASSPPKKSCTVFAQMQGDTLILCRRFPRAAKGARVISRYPLFLSLFILFIAGEESGCAVYLVVVVNCEGRREGGETTTSL